MIETCPDDYTYQVSSPYKVFNLVAVANMSEKNNTSRFMGVGVFKDFYFSDEWKVVSVAP